MKSKVFVVRCPDYSQAGTALEQLISMLGGMQRFAHQGERLLLKANLLQPASPEKAISTHPAVVSAVARLVAEQGATAVIADSPGSGYQYTEGGLKSLYRACGMDLAAQESGAELNYNTSCEHVSYPAGRLMKQFEVISPVRQCQGIINLCKLKTHMFMSMTGAVKNSFGVIPGLSKVGFHARLEDKLLFADMLLDLSDFVSPRLSIMDAVVAMEGQGPGASGTPRPVGLLLASEHPLALDIVAGAVIGLEKERNPLLIAAQRRGLPVELDAVELIGAGLDAIRCSNFKLPETVQQDMLGGASRLLKPFTGLARSALSQTPYVVPAHCVGCGVCQDACPAKAITLTDSAPKKAKVSTRRCIRCYCCHELCPQRAIGLKNGTFTRRIKNS